MSEEIFEEEETDGYESPDEEESSQDTPVVKRAEDIVFDFEQLLPVIQDGTMPMIKAYFKKPESEPNRKALYDYFDAIGDNECPKDCASCMTVDNTFVTCFGILNKLRKERLGIPDVIEKRDKEDILKVSEDPLRCNNCYIAARCGKYKLDATCAYDFTANTDFTDTRSALQILVNLQKERVLRAGLYEKVDGGVPDKNLTSEIQVLQDLIKQIDEKDTPSFKMSVEGKGATGGGDGFVASLMAGIFAGKKEKGLPKKSQQELPEHKEAVPANVLSVETVKQEVRNDSGK